MSQIKKQCVCGKEFWVYPYREKTSLYCSCKCATQNIKHKSGYKCPKGSLAKLGKKNPMWGKNFSKKHRDKIGKSLKEFYKNNPEARKKVGEQFKGKNNWQWKGDDVGYDALHDWVRNHKGKPLTCKNCGITSNEKKIHWANIDHKYKRKKGDWIELCVKCHSEYDRKMNPEHFKPNKGCFKRGQIPWNKGLKKI